MALNPPTPAVTDFGGFASLKFGARANDPDTVKKAAQQFEALFVQQMLKAARASSLGEDVLGGGGQTEFYQDIFDQQMALHLSSGKGMGLADLLAKQLLGATTPATAARSESLVPANAGIQSLRTAPHAPSKAKLDSDVRGNDESPGPAAFIDSIRPHAERAAKQLGVPAEAIMAQAALETGWGKRVPTHADGTPSHNFFGIKAHGGWDGGRLVKTTHEHLGGRMQKVSAEFRSYDSVGEAFDDYARFLQSNPRYAEALRRGDDAAGFARGLQEAGYATDPAYASKLLKLMSGRTISRAGDASNEVAA
jgi:peptidoglycan hydrolase FlgJ